MELQEWEECMLVLCLCCVHVMVASLMELQEWEECHSDGCVTARST